LEGQHAFRALPAHPLVCTLIHCIAAHVATTFLSRNLARRAFGVTVNESRNRRSRRLQFESLESRQMMAVTASLNSFGVLNVVGTSENEEVNFRQYNGMISVSGIGAAWAASRVNTILVDLKGGDDTVSLNSLAGGGNQKIAENVVIKSAIGTDTIRLVSGHVVSLSGAGHMLVVGTDGVATLDGKKLSWNTPAPTPPPTPAPTPTTPTSNNWFDSKVIDAALRGLGKSLYVDGRLDRNDMIAILRNVEDGGVIDATEFADLKSIVSNATLFGTLDYVWKLSSYIVSGNTANAKYQGQALGNLTAGSSSAHMEKLIGKWFLGLDRPTAAGAYRQIAGTLFVGGANYADIKQGYLGDCYFMASLAETALKNPAAINNMFVVNGDGTYTVRFYNNGKAEYVTVDSYLPTSNSGALIYANMGASHANAANELWIALAEKAYVQINEMGWLRSGLPGNGLNAYSAIEGGYIYAALGHITGQKTNPFTSTTASTSFTTFVTAFNQGKSIGFASKSRPVSTSVVGNHAYAVVGYNPAAQTVTFFNPWGTQYGLVTLTWSQVQANFSYFDRTA
jgi:hypothetical protein